MHTSIIVKMTPQDFDLLSDMQMEWGDEGWIAQVKDGRFEDTQVALRAQPMQWAYWFDSPLSCILAKSYLASNKMGYHTTYDLATESWVVFTDYATRVEA
jgi:hypothetical protein